MSHLQKCRCGNEYEVHFQDDILHCEICGEVCCTDCSHTCENPDHVNNDQGCEQCMIYDKELQKWFCSKECKNDVADPYGLLKTAKENMQKMSLAVHEACKAIDEGIATVNNGKLSEAKAMLVTAHELYLKEN